MTKKTLEEYQIQEIAKSVFLEETADFIRRGEFDKYTISNDNTVGKNIERIKALEGKDSERDKDRKSLKMQMIGLGMGVALNVIIWVIAASDGFKVGR